jgi:hypothetical protein
MATFGPIVDCHDHERRLIHLFKNDFSRYPLKGLEYFQGDKLNVCRTFSAFCHGDPSPMEC